MNYYQLLLSIIINYYQLLSIIINYHHHHLDHRLVVQVLVVTVEPLWQTKKLISVLEIVLCTYCHIIACLDIIQVCPGRQSWPHHHCFSDRHSWVVLIFTAGFVIFLLTLSTVRKTKSSSKACHLSFLFCHLHWGEGQRKKNKVISHFFFFSLTLRGRAK